MKPIRNLRTQALGHRSKSHAPNFIAFNRTQAVKRTRNFTPKPNVDIAPSEGLPPPSPSHFSSFKHTNKLTFMSSMSPDLSKPVTFNDIL